MLSMVATRRRRESRSGAIRPMACQAPLNSSMSAINRRISLVIFSVDTSMAASIFSSDFIHFRKGVEPALESSVYPFSSDFGKT